MNKITLLKIALLCSVVSFAQNIDTTKYQKVSPGDTIKNYYDQNNNNTTGNDSIQNYYPPSQNNPRQPNGGRPGGGNARNNPVRKPIPPESPLMQKLYFGCNLGLQFYSLAGGYNIFYYDLSPNVGYKVTDKFSAGVQILYNNTIEFAGGSSVSYNIIGGGIFARFLILKWLFLQAEYDILTTPPSTIFGQKRSISDEKLGGVGFKRPVSNKLSYYITILYDFAPELNSPYYDSPIIYRIGLSYNW
ncbi:MAG TPA: hypothetical protein VKG26_16935 [Bacteroidia bacterium]|nr:hypothetical protein [Bacteroidia bacterium]